MLLKTSLLPLWLASLGATIAIPIRKPIFPCDRYPLTDSPESKFWCDPADGDLSTSS